VGRDDKWDRDRDGVSFSLLAVEQNSHFPPWPGPDRRSDLSTPCMLQGPPDSPHGDEVTRAARQTLLPCLTSFPDTDSHARRWLQPTMASPKAARRPMACLHARDPCPRAVVLCQLSDWGWGLIEISVDISTAVGPSRGMPEGELSVGVTLEPCLSNGLKKNKT
jgi:hypothetical protein